MVSIHGAVSSQYFGEKTPPRLGLAGFPQLLKRYHGANKRKEYTW
jgi:hypothetical protein